MKNGENAPQVISGGREMKLTVIILIAKEMHQI
jgi:hypothetical protein